MKLRMLFTVILVPVFIFAGQIDVLVETSAGSNIFDNVGSIDAYATTNDIATYYQYGTPDAASFNGPAPELQSDLSHMFFVEASDGLAFVHVHDDPHDGSGGTFGSLYILDGDGDGMDLAVSDDAGELNQSLNAPLNSIWVVQRRWWSCCTDGVAFNDIEDDWTLDVIKDYSTQIDGWSAFSSDGSQISLAFEDSRKVRFQSTVIPEPASLGLFGLGAMLVAFFRRRKK